MNKPAIDVIIRDRILILDGGLGTMIQSYGLTENDFRNDQTRDINIPLKGNNDLLTLTRPDVIEDIHRRYLDAGADIIETDTFNAQRISQEDYLCGHLCKDINIAACHIARKVADEYTRRTPDKPRYVAGSIGPTNKTSSLVTDINHPEWRAVSFDQLAAAYGEQIHDLIVNGVDLLLIETIFDTLNAKAALYAVNEQQEKLGTHVPVMVSLTIADKAGRMLSGQDIRAFLASIEFAKPFSVGPNCSFGPKELKPYLHELAAISPYYVSIYPNAGLPNELGEYDVQPDEMASLMKELIDEGMVNIIGGCCGTTDEHIAKYNNIIQTPQGKYIAPRKPLSPTPYLKLSGLDCLELTPDINFVNIGERCNVAGSRKFLRLINSHNYEEALMIAHKQVESGAQIIDINMDDGLLNSKKEMVTFINMLASDPEVSRLPIMIDSSNWDVIEAGLKCVQGKCIVNSISLKEGEESFLKKADYIRRMGAAVVVMAFDEEGQACSYEKKIHICERSYHLLVDELHYNPQDIIFDPNILSIATGIPEHNDYAVNFINATEWIRKHLPGAHVSGGVSNLSFSFRGNNYIREAIHAVFLYHAIKKGMDMGIVNPASKVMYSDISEQERILIEDLIFNRKQDATEQLLKFLSEKNSDDTISAKTINPEEEWKRQPLEQRLMTSLIKGANDFLKDDLEEALSAYSSAVEIIEGPLMDGMNLVGEHFASGKMFLPQVVRSAKIMQNAVTILSPHISDTDDDHNKSLGNMIMATVKGDVHDIGKNIVAVVLKCNNINVIDLGVMCPAEKIVEAAITEKADIIGLCGLITPSLTEMVNVVTALSKAGISVPVLIGGATTSELHTALKIAPAYNGPVIWSKDAAQTSIIATTLLNPTKRDALITTYADRYQKLREKYAQENEGQKANLQDARRNKLNLFNCNCCNT